MFRYIASGYADTGFETEHLGSLEGRAIFPYSDGESTPDQPMDAHFLIVFLANHWCVNSGEGLCYTYRRRVCRTSVNGRPC